MKNFTKEIIFIFITFGFSWIVWLPLVINHNFGTDYPTLPYAHFLGAFGPLFGAICMSFLQKDFNIATKFKFSLPLRAYFWGILSPVLLAFAGYIIFSATNGQLMSLSGLGQNEFINSSNFFIILMIWIFTFGLGEEAGWRGYLLPSLYKKLKPNLAFLTVGVIWILWHIPVFLYHPPYIAMLGPALLGWAFSILCGSFFLGWLAKISNWSIIPVILWHGIFNTFTSSTYSDGLIAGIMSTFVIIFAILIPIFLKNDLLVKKNSN
jgi:membrane protease YdiL (CAAX protease family)